MYLNDSAKQRNSSIELLKIISILMIVIFHVAMTVTRHPDYLTEFGSLFYNFEDFYKIDSVQTFLLTIFYNFGQIGNYLFFICSAWFLCNDNKIKTNKVISIIINVWLISAIFIGIYLYIGCEDLSYQIIKNNLIPITTERNWYILMYLVIYMIHPLLNSVIDKTDKFLLFKILVILLLVYFGVCFFKWGYYYSNTIIYYMIIYLFIGYCKKYFRYIDNKKANTIILFSSLALYCLSLFISYVFKYPLSKWPVDNSILLLVFVFSLFNLFRNININNSIINKVSSLSLFIYVIHENDIFRNFTRVRLMASTISKYGSEHIIIIVLIMAIILFVISCVLAFIYSISIKKIVDFVSDKITNILLKITNTISNKVINKYFDK